MGGIPFNRIRKKPLRSGGERPPQRYKATFARAQMQVNSISNKGEKVFQNRQSGKRMKKNKHIICTKINAVFVVASDGKHFLKGQAHHMKLQDKESSAKRAALQDPATSQEPMSTVRADDIGPVLGVKNLNQRKQARRERKPPWAGREGKPKPLTSKAGKGSCTFGVMKCSF